MTGIHVGTQTFSMPCRRFSIRLTVAKSERLPLVKEFALRLLYVLGDCEVEHVKNFFDFSEREMTILLKDLEQAYLIKIINNKICLTNDAQSKFTSAEESLPYIYVVETWNENFSIDFISYSLIHFLKRSDNFRVFHKLESPDYEKVSISRDVAKQVFADSFHEFVEKYKPSIRAEERLGLSVYGISRVEAGDTFSFPLSVELYIDPKDPVRLHHEYTVFGNDAAQDQRRKLIEEVARKIDSLGRKSRFSMNVRWLFEQRLQDTFYSGFILGERFKITELLTIIMEHRNIIYDDARTVPIVGSFASGENVEALEKMINISIDHYKKNTKSEPKHLHQNLFWQKPSNEFWGREESTFTLFSNFRATITKTGESNSDLSLIINSNYENMRELKKRLTGRNNRNAFDEGLAIALQADMEPVEAFIWPSMIGGVLYYYKESQQYEYPIPIGFITRDPDKLKALAELLLTQWTSHGRKIKQIWHRGEKGGEEKELIATNAFFSIIESLPKKARYSKTLSLPKTSQ